MKQVLKVNNWSILINESNDELIFQTPYQVCYAYLDFNTNGLPILRFDRNIAPKTVVQRAINYAKKNMLSIYDNKYSSEHNNKINNSFERV